jgi:hypothetical protein
VKETGLDPKIEAIQNAGRVYAEQQNHGVDQELWDKFGSAPLKVEGGSYVPFPEKIDWGKAQEGATHILEGFLLNPNFVFCRKDADGEWRWWSETKAMWFVVKTNEDFYVRLKELPAPQSTTRIPKELQFTPERILPGPPPDAVNHPPHYQLREGYEVYDLRQDLAAKAAQHDVPHDQYSDWDRALEYLLRMWGKNEVEDAKKARWYLNKLIEKLETES